MAKSAMQKRKLLHLMRLFYERTDEEHGLTVNEIIESLDSMGITAERKAIYDDIEVLRTFGMDIELRKEKQFRYHLVSRDFELPELKLLVDSVQSSKFISHKKSMELIGKLEGLTSRHQAQRLSRQVYVQNRVKTMNESIYYTVDLIHEAISTNAQIRFQYFDWSVDKEKVLRHGGKVYRVSPFALTRDDENYYLIAYESESDMIRHYRVDKMLNLGVLEEKREGAERFQDFDLAVYTKKTFGMYRGEETLVTIRCKNSLSGVMIDRFGREVSIFKRGDGCFDLNVKVAISPVFLSWLMIFGNDLEVISPASVREELSGLAKKVLEKYK